MRVMGVRIGTRVGQRSWITFPLWMLILGLPFILTYYVIFAVVVLFVLLAKGLFYAGRLLVGGIAAFIILGSREAKKVGRRDEGAEPERSPSGDDSGSLPPATAVGSPETTPERSVTKP